MPIRPPSQWTSRDSYFRKDLLSCNNVAYSFQQMTPSYQLYAYRRATRFRLAETTSAFLQFQDSRVEASELQIISRTGGLLSLSKLVDVGSLVTFMFRTHKGLVFATAEMLQPISLTHQPFRFVDLREDDKGRLQAAFQSELYRNLQEEELIEEFRAAIANWNPPRPKRFFKPMLAVATLAALGSGVIYVLGMHIR